MAINVTSAMVDLKLKAGNGRPTVQNFNASGPDVLLALGAHHVLTAMSGGEDTVTLRELEVAIILAAYVDKERVGSALESAMLYWSCHHVSSTGSGARPK